jgi:hypothetical protein
VSDARLDALTTPHDRVVYDAPYRRVTVNGETMTFECMSMMTFDALGGWVTFTRLAASMSSKG